MIKQIRKRNGELVDFDPCRANQWAEWASGIGVDWSGVVLEATRKCFDGCTTQDFHNALIAACVDRETTAHLKMAGRLFIGDVYKRAFGGHTTIPSVGEMYEKMVGLGLWAKMDYSQEELARCDAFINHSLDLQATLTETKQIVDKYAILDRVAKDVYESPQFVYMRMALGNMEKMPKERRMRDVAKLYYYLSRKYINAPTPFSINLGTPKKQYASCCVITTKDTAPSLAAADHIAYMMTCASAGIGSHLTTRSKGDKVRGGAIVHQGKLPYYRMQEAAVAANKQSSRGGANTMHFTVLDPEIEDLLKLKNVESIADKRIKDIDYSVGYNDFFAKKVAKNEDWMLVSYGDAPDLWGTLYKADQTEFEWLYDNYADPHRKDLPSRRMVKARDIAVAMLTEAVETGRIYEHNTGEMNRHTPFLQTIYSSNLCQEIGLPTEGYESVKALYTPKFWKWGGDDKGEIGLCNLAALAANIPDEEFEEAAYYACLMIDNVIEIMEYPFPHLAYTAQGRRSIGVGITNLAYTLANMGLKYTDDRGKQQIHYLAERHSYWLHVAAVKLAEERGCCDYFSKYNDGWLPVDTANTEVNKIVPGLVRVFDWEPLRERIKNVGGIRFSVLEAHMPCESSSVGSGHTNSLYPIRAGKVMKTSGTNKTLFIAPEWDRLKNNYQLAWDIPTKDMIEVYAIVQQFTGQSISADLYIKYGKERREISAKQLLTEWLYRVRLGMKTRYYINSATGVEAPEEEVDDCEACKL